MMYRIDGGKVSDIAEILDTDHVEAITEYCCGQDWAEGDEHQQWLDSATAAEIADWIRSNPEGWEATRQELDEAADRHSRERRRQRLN